MAGIKMIHVPYRGAGWNAFPIYEFGTPSIFASTRKLIASTASS